MKIYIDLIFENGFMTWGAIILISKTQVVVKNGKKYGSYSDEKPSIGIHRDLYRNITSAILNLKFRKRSKNQTFVIELGSEESLFSISSEGREDTWFWSQVLNEKNQFSKVRITYLIKIIYQSKLEWYFKVKMGWSMVYLEPFSYPYKSWIWI